ncbi:MAG TPA: lipoyl synthase [Nitrospirales bacterium]|nr:lipoyl synthase [Nitrospiraceae bacterium]HNP29229.1 lipoyl synthase [Nitrospirales bacterium]
MTFIPASEITPAASSSNASRRGKLPSWFKVRFRSGPHYQEIRQLMDTHRLHTICEEARCPNIWECWNNRTATFLILGDICTRRCHYCSVTTGRPSPVDGEEPQRVANAVKLLKLRHAVVTSVNRDDLPDGGATLFAETIHQIRHENPTCTIEVLIPDFQGAQSDLEIVMRAKPDILNHNIETVPRLFPSVRPQGKYRRSLQVLHWAKALGGRTKSGLMAGLGESNEEIRQVMRDLREKECDILTIGQYLQPTLQHAPVSRYYTPEEFEQFKQEGLALGFQHVESGPMVRSSYHAEEQTHGQTCV